MMILMAAPVMSYLSEWDVSANSLTQLSTCLVDENVEIDRAS